MKATTPPGGRRGRRPRMLLAVAVVAVVALVGCGGSAPSTGEAGSGAGSGGAFPRTIEHAMGQTTIEQRPQRVISLDRTFTDAALTLDAEVIGFTTFREGVSELPAYLQRAGGQHLSDAQPVGTLSEPNVETITRLQPGRARRMTRQFCLVG